MSENQKQITEEQITWAYNVLESFREAFDKVAATKNPTEKLNLTRQLNQEYLENLPKLCEAIMLLTPLEHRQVVYNFFLSYAGVYESWRKQPAK